GNGSDSRELEEFLENRDPALLWRAIRNLGGHDFGELRSAFARIDDSRPTVILAYTIKGYGLPLEGHPQNHSALMSTEQFEHLASTLGMDPVSPWQRFPPKSAEGLQCSRAAQRLARPSVAPGSPPQIPADMGRTPAATTSTQAGFGRV